MKHAGSDGLISHGSDDDKDLESVITSRKARIRDEGDLPGATVGTQIHLLDELSRLKLGRFLLENRGLNAYWTHQLVTYSQEDTSRGFSSDLEFQIYERLPTALATRERFGIFRKQLQTLLAPNLTLASIPCGLMGEMLLLDYSQHPGVTLLGIDLDEEALSGARALAAERGLSDSVSLRCEDAWSLSLRNEVDVLASNGLNIYEPDDARVTALYRAFFDALKPSGTLVTSFLTPPPGLSKDSPWDFAQIDPQSLALQHLLFTRLIEAKWSTFRTHAQSEEQLRSAGFIDIRFLDDRARMFPTMVARKPG